MIGKLVLFGATGDLTGRFLLPALASLIAADKLPEGFQVVGAAREDMDDEAFRRAASERLVRHASHVPATARETLVRSLRYRAVELDDPESVARAVRDDISSTDTESASANAGEPLAAYLALPPGVFPTAVTALGTVGLPAGSRIVVEKPFGEDLKSAVALNRLLGRVSGIAGEDAVFRVDHVLGMATVQNLLGLRLANRILEPVWNSVHIAQVDILWEETLALEGRAGYYDRAGALKDVMQNHMLQIFCLLAMEPPPSLGQRDLRDRKVELLRSVRPLTPEEIPSRTRRARYTAGRLASTGGASGENVPAYAEEDGVDPERHAETFAEVVLDLDNARWAGTRFVLRAGKALAQRRKMVVVRFRPASYLAFDGNSSKPAGNELRIGIDGPEDITLHLTGSAPGPPPHPVGLTFTAPPLASELSPYSRVLLNILDGDSTLSVRGDEAEQAWRILAPVLQAWAEGRVELEEYQAGSAGPQPRDHGAEVAAP
jgi:glucose-6-phosphate 1-dehydrogenase